MTSLAETIYSANLEEIAAMIQMKELMELPAIKRFANLQEIKTLKKITEKISNKKNKIKLLKEYSLFSDYMSENFNDLSLYRISNFFKDDAYKVINILRNFVHSIHELKDVIPNFNKSDSKEEIFEVLKKIKKYNREDFLTIFKRINRKSLRKKILVMNKDNILMEITRINQAELNRLSNKTKKENFGKDIKTYEYFKSLKQTKTNTYIQNIDIPGLTFTKDYALADFWGRETNCCLRIGGVAGKLLNIIECSPIAGELVGKFNNYKMSSYTWDMVECIEGKAYKTLILDNIEASKKIPEKDVEQLFDKIFDSGKYKTIYLGTVRNDCEINNKYQTKKRQSKLAGFENVMNSNFYMHADSDMIYEMRDRTESSKINLRKMNLSDLNLVKYIEQYIYGDIYLASENTNILTEVKLDTPCYIIDNETNIYGYFLTKFKNVKYSSDGKTHKKKVFYIEDIVMSKNKEVILKLKDIFDEVLKFLEKNNIKEVGINFNKNSINFKKRLLDKGIKIIYEEGIGDIKPINYLK